MNGLLIVHTTMWFGCMFIELLWLGNVSLNFFVCGGSSSFQTVGEQEKQSTTKWWWTIRKAHDTHRSVRQVLSLGGRRWSTSCQIKCWNLEIEIRPLFSHLDPLKMLLIHTVCWRREDPAHSRNLNGSSSVVTGNIDFLRSDCLCQFDVLPVRCKCLLEVHRSACCGLMSLTTHSSIKAMGGRMNSLSLAKT
jgi:hypothetical protein